MTQLWSFDLGEMSGVALGHYSPKEAYTLRQTWMVPGGMTGFKDFLLELRRRRVGPAFNAEAVCELFVLSMGNEFAADLEGVRAEGTLDALWTGLPIMWQPRYKKFMGYANSNRADLFLKEHGFWQKPPAHHEDSRDVNDTIIHALVNLRDRKHLPTLRAYFKDEDDVREG